MNYSYYIKKYWQHNAGEHHLVAIFLIPALQDLFGDLPIYVNPDGMKSIQGDLVYLCGNKKFSIEVKLEKLRLTKVQYSKDYKPDILLYFNEIEVGFADWNAFQSEYVKKMDSLRLKGRKYNNYGPTINANEIETISFGSQDEILSIVKKRYAEC